MRLIDDWHKVWRLWSVWCMGAVIATPTVVEAMPSRWHEWLATKEHFLMSLLAGMGVAARIVKQAPLGETEIAIKESIDSIRQELLNAKAIRKIPVKGPVMNVFQKAVEDAMAAAARDFLSSVSSAPPETVSADVASLMSQVGALVSAARTGSITSINIPEIIGTIGEMAMGLEAKLPPGAVMPTDTTTINAAS